MEELQPGQVYQFDGMEYRIFRARADYDCFRCGKRIEKDEVYARWIVHSWYYTADPLCVDCFRKFVAEFHPERLAECGA